jgi:hypothetical protein
MKYPRTMERYLLEYPPPVERFLLERRDYKSRFVVGYDSLQDAARELNTIILRDICERLY